MLSPGGASGACALRHLSFSPGCQTAPWLPPRSMGGSPVGPAIHWHIIRLRAETCAAYRLERRLRVSARSTRNEGCNVEGKNRTIEGRHHAGL